MLWYGMVRLKLQVSKKGKFRFDILKKRKRENNNVHNFEKIWGNFSPAYLQYKKNEKSEKKCTKSQIFFQKKKMLKHGAQIGRGGCQIGGGCRRHFLYLIFFGENFFLKFSLFFSNFLGIHFYVLAFRENFLKFSQIFSFFLEFSRRGGGARSGGVVVDIFCIWLFGGKIISIFSDFLGMHFLYRRYAGEILPQIFSKLRTDVFVSLVFFNISNLNFPWGLKLKSHQTIPHYSKKKNPKKKFSGMFGHRTFLEASLFLFLNVFCWCYSNFLRLLHPQAFIGY